MPVFSWSSVLWQRGSNAEPTGCRGLHAVVKRRMCLAWHRQEEYRNIHPHLSGFCSLWQSLLSLVHLCLYAKMIKSVMITFLGFLCFFLFLFCKESFRASEDLISILVIAGAFDNLFFSSLDYSFSVLFVSSFWQLHPQFWIILDFYC